MRKKSKEVKKAKGTLRKHREEVYTVNAISNIPETPDYFKAQARKVWELSLQELKENICNTDLRTFEEYCFQYDIIESLRQEMKLGPVVAITNNGGGESKIKNPAFTVYSETFNRIHKMAVEFGLTPLSRTKITVPEKVEDSPEQQAKDKLQTLRSKSGAGKVVQMKQAPMF